LPQTRPPFPVRFHRGEETALKTTHSAGNMLQSGCSSGNMFQWICLKKLLSLKGSEHVSLKDLGVYQGKAGDIETVVSGVWNFDWVLKGTDQCLDLNDLRRRLEIPECDFFERPGAVRIECTTFVRNHCQHWLQADFECNFF